MSNKNFALLCGSNELTANRSASRKGISLVELMLVVMILSILVSFASMYYSSISNDARMVKAKQDMESIKNAIKLYRVDTRGQYPPNIDALIGKYMPFRPVDPWGSAYNLDTNNLEVYCILKNTGQRISVRYGLK